ALPPFFSLPAVHRRLLRWTLGSWARAMNRLEGTSMENFIHAVLLEAQYTLFTDGYYGGHWVSREEFLTQWEAIYVSDVVVLNPGGGRNSGAGWETGALGYHLAGGKPRGSPGGDASGFTAEVSEP